MDVGTTKAPVMRCRKCGGKSQVIESRTREGQHKAAKTLEPGRVYRRRECLACKKRWNTVEMEEALVFNYDLERQRDDAKQRLRSFRQLILDLERMTR